MTFRNFAQEQFASQLAMGADASLSETRWHMAIFRGLSFPPGVRERQGGSRAFKKTYDGKSRSLRKKRPFKKFMLLTWKIWLSLKKFKKRRIRSSKGFLQNFCLNYVVTTSRGLFIDLRHFSTHTWTFDIALWMFIDEINSTIPSLTSTENIAKSNLRALEKK